MGLAVSVGLLAFQRVNDVEGAEELRDSLSKVNEVLQEKHLPQHNEPEDLPNLESRDASGSYPYSFLHHLRRVFANITADPNWIPTPTPEDEDPADDSVLDEEMFMFSSHLLCHSDCEGFYLPIKFDEIIVDDKNQNRIAGGFLGSSYCLLDELVPVAPKLGIKLNGCDLSDSEAEKINKDCERDEGLWREKMVWLSLFEAAHLSIEYKTAICFG